MKHFLGIAFACFALTAAKAGVPSNAQDRATVGIRVSVAPAVQIKAQGEGLCIVSNGKASLAARGDNGVDVPECRIGSQVFRSSDGPGLVIVSAN